MVVHEEPTFTHASYMTPFALDQATTCLVRKVQVKQEDLCKLFREAMIPHVTVSQSQQHHTINQIRCH